MANVPKPVGRKDKYYTYLINGSGELPTPVDRVDRYLYYLCVNGFSGGGAVTPERIQEAVDNYLAEHPVQPGATEEQAAQIDQNTQDISDIADRLNAEDESNMTEDEMLDFLFKNNEGGAADGQ